MIARIQKVLLYLFVFLLPLQARYIFSPGLIGGQETEYGTIALYATELLLGLLVIGALVLACTAKRADLPRRANRMFPFFYLMLALAAAAGLSLVWAPDRSAAIMAAVRLLEGLLLVLVLVATPFSYRTLGYSFVWSGMLQASLAIYQWFEQRVAASTLLGVAAQTAARAGASVIESDGFRWLRAYGTFPHPNMLGAFLALAIVMAVILVFTSRNRREEFGLWGIIVVLTHGLFFTFSKAAALALGVGGLFLLTFLILNHDRGSRRMFAQFAMIVATVVGVLAVIHADPLLTRLQGSAELEQRSFAERAQYLEDARGVVSYSWLSGIGVGNYVYAIARVHPGLEAWEYQPVHNVFVLVLAETGIIGFVALLLLFADTLKTVYRFRIDYSASLLEVYQEYDREGLYEKYNFEFHWFLGAAALICMCMTMALFDHYFWTLYSGIMLLWLFFGLFIKQAGYVRK